uniref:Diamine acetyltransferase 2 n=1 Tax=Culex pipiens TaxID=7175 RepID=A0A8D8KDK9_CULPI
MAFQSSVVARKTTKQDLGAIIGMIQELADFEKMSDGPQLTVEDLARDGGFDDHGPSSPVFQSFVLELTERAVETTAASEETSTSSTIANDGDLSTRTKLIGYAIFFYSYSTWRGKSLFLEDIYVKPEHRGHGNGEVLFKAVVEHARENGCARVDFHVLGWNPAKKFYARMGAENLTETEQWEFFRLTRDKMDRLSEATGNVIAHSSFKLNF